MIPAKIHQIFQGHRFTSLTHQNAAVQDDKTRLLTAKHDSPVVFLTKTPLNLHNEFCPILNLEESIARFLDISMKWLI